MLRDPLLAAMCRFIALSATEEALVRQLFVPERLPRLAAARAAVLHRLLRGRAPAVAEPHPGVALGGAFMHLGYDRPLAWVLLLGALIPSVDLSIVLSQPTASLALPHLTAIGLCLGLAWSFFTLPATSARVG